MTFLKRYNDGEHEGVWADLLALGEGVREPSILADALSVARATIRRARFNIETLIPRLQSVGYRFGYDWTLPLLEYEQKEQFEAKNDPALRKLAEDVGLIEAEKLLRSTGRAGITDWVQVQPPIFAPARADARAKIAMLEQRVGPMPLSLLAWYELVHAVNFVGTPPPDWHPMEAVRFAKMQGVIQQGKMEEFQSFAPTGHDLDPLFIGPLETSLAELETLQFLGEPLIPFFANISPDEHLKYYTSGAGAYVIKLPNRSADALLEGEWHHTTFVNYLRICFRWGGFPGLETTRQISSATLAHFTEGLLPL